MRVRHLIVATAAAGLAACTTQPTAPPQPIPLTPPKEVPSAPVARVPIPESVPVPGPATPSGAAPALVFPPNVLYLCVTEANGTRQQTAIEFTAKVGELCRRHPEMGPCQYERDICRRAGGRVFANNGAEITRATEADYDKKVLRVRFRAD